MSGGFAAMQQVRAAYLACCSDPLDGAAAQRFVDAHQQNENAYVDAFEVAGITYPRTDGHRLSESQARDAISAYVAAGGAPAHIKPAVIASAYPQADEVMRIEIEAMLVGARAIVALDWRTAQLDAALAARLRELLRMPAEAGSYADLRSRVQQAARSAMNPYRGQNADHLIPDQLMRGIGTVRAASPTVDLGFATFLLDGQNNGSQHKFATDAQNAVRNLFRSMGRNPSVGEYLEHVRGWMTNIYVRSDLAVDGVAGGALLQRKAEFEALKVKGYAIAQAGFMTWPERQMLGSALATALVIQARDHYAAIGWPMSRELQVVQAVPATAGALPSIRSAP